jgi:hypothetical protein
MIGGHLLATPIIAAVLAVEKEASFDLLDL